MAKHPQRPRDLNIKVTPAMAAGVPDRLWEVADMVNVLEAWEGARAKA